MCHLSLRQAERLPVPVTAGDNVPPLRHSEGLQVPVTAGDSLAGALSVEEMGSLL